MLKQGRFLVFIMVLCIRLTGCISGLWTGASMIYDRHNIYKKLSDYRLLADVTNSIMTDKKLKGEGCVLDMAVFNGDVLIVGHLPTEDLFDEMKLRLKSITGYRRLYNEVTVCDLPNNNFQDAWITAKIRSFIFSDGSIDPKAFKVLTADKVVYLMGDVRKEQAEKVIAYARQVSGVVRVVKILRYYTYQSNKSVA